MRILVIEDEKKVAKFIKSGLEEERYTVEVAHDGVTGLEQALNHYYDVIILDVMLPRKSGMAVLTEIRNAGLATPILMLTARGTTDDKVMGLDLGADDYLPKPFHFEELVARIRAISRRTATEKNTKIYCNDLVLDTVSHLAYRFNEEVELTTKEYLLLEYLMRNKNKIVSRSLIMQHVWKTAFDSESNIIDVYIKRLRNKIEKPGQERILYSVRGSGYRVRERLEGKAELTEQEFSTSMYDESEMYEDDEDSTENDD